MKNGTRHRTIPWRTLVIALCAFHAFLALGGGPQSPPPSPETLNKSKSMRGLMRHYINLVFVYSIGRIVWQRLSVQAAHLLQVAFQALSGIQTKTGPSTAAQTSNTCYCYSMLSMSLGTIVYTLQYSKFSPISEKSHCLLRRQSPTYLLLLWMSSLFSLPGLPPSICGV